MMVRSLMMLLTFLSVLNACAQSTQVQPPQAEVAKASNNHQFLYPMIDSDVLLNPLTLWATYYYLPQYKVHSGNIPIRGMDGKELGPTLSLADWCNAALEGSMQILFEDGSLATYNYAGTTDDSAVDCSSIFSFKLGRTKFRLAKGSYGDGIRNYILVPYRTIATDRNVIPPGTVLYIPDARGAVITLPDGQIITHDGYFFAGDTGGAIKGNHIDVFIGKHNHSSFFPWVGNQSSKTFLAYVVQDQKIIDELTRMHLPLESTAHK